VALASTVLALVLVWGLAGDPAWMVEVGVSARAQV
jgi:hypothetical protein